MEAAAALDMAASLVDDSVQTSQVSEDWHGGAYPRPTSKADALKAQGLSPDCDTTSPTSPEDSADEAPPVLKCGSALAQMGAALQAEGDEKVSITLQENASPTRRQEGVLSSPGLSVKMVGVKVKVYYVQVKDGIVEIIGKVGNTIVFMKARACEVACAPIERLKEVECSVRRGTEARVRQTKEVFNAQTLHLQDTYMSITVAVEGQLVYVKAKLSELFTVAEAKASNALVVISDFTSPVTCRVGSFLHSSKARAQTALRPLEPHYVKVHNGVVNIAATVGNTAILIQAKTTDIYNSIQVRTVESTSAARAAIVQLTSPAVSRVMRLPSDVSLGIQHFKVSLKNGVLCIKGATGDFVAKLSSVAGAISAKTMDGLEGTKRMISDLTSKLAAFVSGIYCQALDSARLLYTNTRDGLLYVVFQVNNRVAVLRMKIDEVAEWICLMSKGVYSSSCSAILNGCSSVKVRVLQATQITKTKAIEVSANIRNIAGNPKTQVTLASAAGGAVALGASGGAAGLVAGGGMGAGCGLVLAPFTLGLSIPVGAVLGAGSGLCIGATAGGTAGIAAGGAAGYSAHKHKDGIGNGITSAVSKVRAYKSMAAASTNKLCAQVMGSTGGAGLA